MKICACLPLGAGAFLLAGAVAAPVTPKPDPSSALKPYVLFMSTDVSVERNKKLYRVQDVSGRNFIVTADGQSTAVPMSGQPHQIEFQHKLTLARASASLTGLESGRVYTVAHDPKMKRQRDSVLAEAVIGDSSSYAQSEMVRGLNNDYLHLDANARVDPTDLNSMPLPGAKDSVEELWRRSAETAKNEFVAQQQAEELRQSNLSSGAFGRLAAENDMKQEQFDAVSVRFEVSSPVYLAKPYLVVITRFHTRDDKPGQARNSVYARALDPIGSKPAKIDVLQGGFPAGFEIEEQQVHLYNEGREIPTEAAQKRVPLSRDEAFEYLKIEYASDHKGDTLIATPAIGRPDREEQQKLTPNQWKTFYYVKVSKDGLPLGTYVDEDCTEPAEGRVGSLAQNVRYYPALQKGRPVEGTARLRFSEVPL